MDLFQEISLLILERPFPLHDVIYLQINAEWPTLTLLSPFFSAAEHTFVDAIKFMKNIWKSIGNFAGCHNNGQSFFPHFMFETIAFDVHVVKQCKICAWIQTNFNCLVDFCTH